MDDQDVRRTARIRYRLTEAGHTKLQDAFLTLTGERRKFGTIQELDPRTVARIYYNEEPFDLASLMILFRVLKRDLLRGDYERAVKSGPPTPALPSGAAGTGNGAIASRGAVENVGVPDGGAEPLVSPFYIERSEDALLKAAIRRRDSTILIKGQRHCGKSSLLARGFEEARRANFQTACTNFDLVDPEQIRSKEALYRAFANTLALQCGAEDPEGQWRKHRSPTENLEFYLRSFLGQSIASPLVWAMDGVDALVGCGFHEDVFAMFRAWHNARRNEPDGPWDRLCLVLTYAAEASLLISSSALSPFNVAKPILLKDFNLDELCDLNRRYGCPLASPVEENRLFALCGGHPFLSRLALYEVKSERTTLQDIERAAHADGGLFRPYLDELREDLRRDAEYKGLVTAVAAGAAISPGVEVNRCFQRLRSAGVLTGDSADRARFRCELYQAHFGKYPL